MSDLTIRRGDDKTITVTVVGSTGSAVNLTGATIWWYVKVSQYDPDSAALIRKRTGAGITIDPDQTANRGKATISVLAADTTTLHGTNVDTDLLWELQVKDAAGVIDTPARGTIQVSTDIVRTSA